MRKPIITLSLLILTLAIAQLPKPHYTSPDVLSTFKIPAEMKYWKSRDVSGELNVRDKRYAFLSRIFAREYVNDLGEPLTFMVLDAGNFHHPKVCFGASGFHPMPQSDIQVNVRGKNLAVSSIFMQKGPESELVVYWITINGRSVNWTRQKFTEFYYSLIGKQKAGFMGRLDIPAPTGNIAAATELAKGFIKDISKELSEREAGMLFGENLSS